MCIVCDAKRFNQSYIDVMEEMVANLATHLNQSLNMIEEFKRVYSSQLNLPLDKAADEVVKGGRALLAGTEQPKAEPQTVVDALKVAFPDAQVVVGTSEQIAAFLEKQIVGKKDN